MLQALYELFPETIRFGAGVRGLESGWSAGLVLLVENVKGFGKEVVWVKGFMEFIRKQGVMGLAVGFILGGAVSKVVSSLVSDLINPILGIFLGATKGLETAALKVGPAQIMWGHFLSVLIDFLVVALVVYYGVKGLGLDKLDKKKD